jgi:hypothetical protein
MKNAHSFLFFALLASVLLFISTQAIPGTKQPLPYPDISRVSGKQCLQMLGSAHPPVLIDVRLKSQFEESLNKLPGAVHEDPENVKAWAHKYKKDAPVVLY